MGRPGPLDPFRRVSRLTSALRFHRPSACRATANRGRTSVIRLITVPRSISSRML